MELQPEDRRLGGRVAARTKKPSARRKNERLSGGYELTMMACLLPCPFIVEAGSPRSR